jgi:hypothetical protein
MSSYGITKVQALVYALHTSGVHAMAIPARVRCIMDAAQCEESPCWISFSPSFTTC